jgi:hypothetical protein
MNFSTDQLLSFLRKPKDAFATHGRGAIAHPERDWKIVLLGSMAALCLLAALAALFYWEQKGDRRIGGIPAPTERAFTPEKLEKLLQKHRSLGSEHEALLAAPSPIADPSQPK